MTRLKEGTNTSSLSKSYIRLLKNAEIWQTNLQRAMHIVASHSQRALDVARCSVWLMDESRQFLRCETLATDALPTHEEALTSDDFPEYFAALETGRILTADNVHADLRTQCLVESYFKPRGIFALLDATLRREGSLFGVVCFEHTTAPRKWTDEEIHHAASIADLLSQLIVFYSLHDSELRYRTVFDSTGDALIIIRDNQVCDCNAAALKLLRCSRKQFLGQPLHKLWNFPEGTKIGTYERFEWQQTRWDNTSFHADVTLTQAKLDNENHLVASVRDISDRKEASDQLLALNSLHQAIFDGTSYCIIATDLNGIIHTFNRAAEEFLRYQAKDVIDRLTPLAFHDDRELKWRAEALSEELGYEVTPNFEVLVAKARLGKMEEYEWSYQRKDSSELPVSLSVAPLRDGDENICGFLFMAADITERKKASDALIDSQREMERRANHDSLTGLPNRSRLHNVAAVATFNANRSGHKLAFMLLDLNRFKDINDTLGHAIGDQILKEIAKRLQPMLLRHGAYLYRLGGDEFAVLIPKINQGDEAISLASFIASSLRQPIVADGISLEIAGSIGIAIYPDHGATSHALLRCADVAMYRAKSDGQPLAFYEPDHDAHSTRRLMLMAELGNAIRNNELVLYYQPKIDLETHLCTSCEALIRWEHPKLGLILPTEFIPMAEMTEIIKQLSEWVVANTIKQAAKWQHMGLELDVSVNLSARNLIDQDFPNIIDKLLKDSSFKASNLEVEITESALISDPERSLQIIERIHRLGVKFAIDDFGTGYSSLAYLKKLPLNTLKIDRTFVSDMLNDEQDATIISSTIGLAHSFGLKVVAEGVEDEATLRELAALKCEAIQGYHISEPLPAEAFETWCQNHNNANKNQNQHSA